MLEETRYIVFLSIDGVARSGERPGAWAWRALVSARYYGRAIRRLVGTIRRGQKENDGKDFSATQANVFLEGFTFRRFVEECYAENARRMADFHTDLLRPRFLPSLAGAALSGLRLLPARRVTPDRS